METPELCLVLADKISSFISVVDPVDNSEKWKKDVSLDIEEKEKTRVRFH